MRDPNALEHAIASFKFGRAVHRLRRCITFERDDAGRCPDCGQPDATHVAYDVAMQRRKEDQ